MEAIAVTDRGQVVAGLIDGRVAEGYRLARAILLDDDEAEDAVQDACLNAWLKRSSLRERDRFDAWFDRIVVNVCRDVARRGHGVRHPNVAARWPTKVEGGWFLASQTNCRVKSSGARLLLIWNGQRLD